MLFMYVDDIIVTCDDEERRHLGKNLVKEFETKTIEKLKYFLRIKVACLRKESSNLNRNALPIFYNRLARQYANLQVHQLIQV